MELRNRSTGEIVTLAEFKRLHAGTSFPRVITADIFQSFGYDPIHAGVEPEVTGPYQVSTRQGVEEIDGQWYTKFVVGPVFASSDDETAYRSRIDSDVAKNVRRDRDSKLTACDWTVLTDSPLTTAKKTEWKAYRTALRNISAAEGFPHTMEWPTEPS